MNSIAEMQQQILLNILRELGTYPDAFTQDEKTANTAMYHGKTAGIVPRGTFRKNERTV